MKQGRYIKKLRLNKGLTQEQLSNGILTSNHLSKVEREESELSVETFFKLLDRLNVTFSEYESLYELDNDSQWNTNRAFAVANTKEDRYLFEQIYEKEKRFYKKDGNIRHYHNQLLAKVFIAQLSGTTINPKDLRKISAYLFEVEEWGIYEISLFGNFAQFLSPDLCHQLLSSIFKKSQLFMTHRMYLEQVSQILLNVYYGDIEKKEWSYAKEIEMELERLLSGTSLYYEKTQFQFLKGLYQIGIGEKEEGRERCQAAIRYFYFIQAVDKAQSHQKVLERYLQL